MSSSEAAQVHKSAANSYDRITKQHKQDTPQDDLVPYRFYNNYIKKILIQYGATGTGPTRTANNGFSVLDLASGRGGDLGKWLFAHVLPPYGGRMKPSGLPLQLVKYVGVDISPECIAEAQRRFDIITQAVPKDDLAKKELTFEVGNCFSPEWWASKHDNDGAEGADDASVFAFDVVSVQFAFHYGCDKKESVDATMKAVSAVMTPGGVFIATIVNAEQLAWCRANNKLKNGLYDVCFVDPDTLPADPAAPLPFGTPYHFGLEGHVDNVEYVIPFEDLCAAAECHGLKLVPAVSFPFADKIAEFEAAPQTVKKLKGQKMNQDEKELVSLYRTVCFEKPLSA